MRKRFIFDCETNGLLNSVTRVHLIIMFDMDTEELLVFRETDAEKGVKLLEQADLLVGHNIIAYDIPMLEKLFPWFAPTGVLRDTLVLSRLVCSNIKERDFVLFRKGQLPGKLIGRHSVEAWGYRLGEYKGDYGKNTDNDDDTDIWAEWSQEMEDYGIQDVRVSVKIWEHIQARIAKEEYSQDAIRLEHRFADLVARMERNGFIFDAEKAKVLYDELSAKRDAIKEKLQEQFRPWYVGKWVNGKKPWTQDSAVVTVPTKTITYKEPNKASRVEGAAYCEVTLKEFNPGSRDMIADRLQRLFGWVPQQFTETGKPKVSEDILKDLVGTLDEEEDGVEESEDQLYDKLIKSIPQAKDLADYLMIVKRLGQLYDGKNGWLKLARDGKIHGTINSLGAVTRRVTHARPNVSQAPAVRSPYGTEMRSCWTTPKDWLLFGTDLSGIEIRCFAHVLSEFDGGEYGRLVIEDDIHTVNMKAFGVPTRDDAKTTLYATLYGGGDAKIGAIIGGTAADGKRIKRNFTNSVPAYGAVVKKLTKLVERNGWIHAIDGGRIYVESSHKALNSSLQSMGALIAKRWTLQFEDNLLDAGLEHGWHGDFVFNAFVHDEDQVSFRAPDVDWRNYEDINDYEGIDAKKAKKLKEERKFAWVLENSEVARIMAREVKRAIKQVEEYYNFNCPLDCEYKFGKNWADTH